MIGHRSLGVWYLVLSGGHRPWDIAYSIFGIGVGLWVYGIRYLVLDMGCRYWLLSIAYWGLGLVYRVHVFCFFCYWLLDIGYWFGVSCRVL